LKKEGYADSTLKAYDSRLRLLARQVKGFSENDAQNVMEQEN
jgi:hypothetical protein